MRFVDKMLGLLGRKYKYFASICKLVHCWRDKCKRIYDAWKEVHGAESAMRFARKLPARCIAGRWGSISNTEAYLTSFGPDPMSCMEMALPVLRMALVAKADKKRHRSAQDDALAEEGDDPHLEEMKAFSAQMGRWSKAVARDTADQLLWVTLHVASRSRQPIDLFSRFMQSYVAEEEMNTRGGRLAQLIDGKMFDIFAEFEATLSDQSFMKLNGVDANLHTDARRLGVLLVLCLAAGFRRRVLVPLNRCQCRIYPELRVGIGLMGSCLGVERWYVCVWRSA